MNPGPLKVRLWVTWILNLALDLSLYKFEIEMCEGPEIRIKGVFCVCLVLFCFTMLYRYLL